MESDLEQYPHNLLDHYPQQHQKQMNSGLTRYQSAPSSLFSSLLDDEFFNRPSSPETERIFAQFLSSDGGAAADGGSTDNFSAPSVQISPIKEVAVKVEPPQTPRMSHMNAETGFMHPPPPAPAGNFTSAPHNLYQSQPRPQPDSRSSMEYNIANSIGTDRLPPMKTSGGGNSNLTRHNSSPAGLFSNFQVENGYPMMRNRNLAPNSSENPGYGFPPGSWDNSAMIPSNRKRLDEEDRTISSEIQNVDTGSRPLPILAHHLSLPKVPVEMSALDQLLQDSVACKIRAKRGCATHPRSIAERVRRTKISERMRKLQDLVPNMDKQTNTSDMLDLAVEYIKDLQTQVKSLSDARANCKCAVGN